MPYERKTKELRKIKQTENWIDLISKMREFQYDDERYYSREDFHRLLEKFYKYVDTRVLFWALSAYKDIVKKWKE